MKPTTYLNKTVLRYASIGFFIIALTIFLMATTLKDLRQEAMDTHRRIAELYAYTFEEHFSQMLHHLNFSIDRLMQLSVSQKEVASLSPLLHSLCENVPYIRSFSISDETGKIIASSLSNNIDRSIDLHTFLPIPFGDDALLRIGVPQEGRDFFASKSNGDYRAIDANGIFFLPVIKKITLENRPYYVAVSINTDYLYRRYLSVLPPEQGTTLSIWRIDGTLLFSSDRTQPLALSHYTPQHPKDHEDFYEHVKHYVHHTLNVFRSAHTFGFIVEIKTDEQVVLTYGDKERRKILWLSAALILCLGVLFATLVIRYLRENERQKRQLTYEKQFRIAMEATQTGLWTWDIISDRVTWDPQCFKLLGYEPDAFEISLEKIYQLTHPDEAATMYFAIKEQIIAKHAFVIERRMLNARNEWVYVQVRGKAVEMTDEGEPKLLTGVYINIDAQKKAEHLHLSAVAFEAQEAILITDANEKILKANEAFTRITGYSESEIIGETPRFFRSGKHDKAFYTAMWQELLTKGFWQGEMWNKRKNEEVFAEFLTITAIKNAEGKTTHYIANLSDITQHKVAQEQIHEMAYYDPLTHLANRRLLDETMQHLWDEGKSKPHYHALLFIDLDHFKTLNDRYGHDAGDMLLVQVAARLKDVVRKSDLAVRLGGDEFIVVLCELGNHYGMAHYLSQSVAQKILTHLCEPYALLEGNYTIGASIGCVLFTSDTHPDITAILKEADSAMYQAKAGGRNRIYFRNDATPS